MIVHVVNAVIVCHIEGLFEVIQRRRLAIVAAGLVQLLPREERRVPLTLVEALIKPSHLGKIFPLRLRVR